jgi:hypothetical protein
MTALIFGIKQVHRVVAVRIQITVGVVGIVDARVDISLASIVVLCGCGGGIPEWFLVTDYFVGVATFDLVRE